MKVSVDREKCIGCGACVSICPKTFQMFEGKAKVKTSELKKITCEKDAEESCPVQAISLK